MRTLVICLLAMLAAGQAVYAQPDRRDVRKGNRDFRNEDWNAAEIDYMKALNRDSSSVAANYNLANTLYKKGDYDQARKTYDRLKETAPGTDIASDWYYNSGNAASMSKDWAAAVEAYRQSLLLNPGDMDAKENYIYAREMLKNQQNQQNQGQDNKDSKDNKDNQDNRDKQNDDDGQDNQDNRQNQDNKDNGGQDNRSGASGQQPKITPQAAQQMLQAIQAKEKETQEKVKKEKAEALKSRQKEKNW
jgi:tetratricopeptide (TPR) repeat protein